MNIGLRQGGVHDIAQNLNAFDGSVAVAETRDSILPVLQSATLNYSTGIMRITASETIDATPHSKVDTSKFYLVNSVGSNLAGSEAYR